MHDLVTVLVSVVLALGGGEGLRQLLTYRQQKRNLNSASRRDDAEAEVALSDGALRRITAAEDRAERAETKADQAIDELRKIRRRLFGYDMWAAQHQIWDQAAVAGLHAKGIDLRPPPELHQFLNEGA